MRAVPTASAGSEERPHNTQEKEMTKERKNYLDDLADEYDVDRETVYAIASMLGETEDYDGLVTELENFANECWD